MSRFTQYIGLNDEGIRFVTGLTPIKNYEGEEGICGEPVYYSRWMDPKTGLIYKEVTQLNPWSSGPMFFTCVEDEYGRKYGKWAKAIYRKHHSEYDSKNSLVFI